MTALWQQVIERVQALPEAEQEHLAALVLAELEDDDERWRRSFADHPEALDRLVQAAEEDRQQGRVRPLTLDDL